MSGQYQVKCKICGVLCDCETPAVAKQRQEMHIFATRHSTWINKQAVKA